MGMPQYPAYLSPGCLGQLAGVASMAHLEPLGAAQVLLWSMQGASATGLLATSIDRDMAVSELHFNSQLPSAYCLQGARALL